MEKCPGILHCIEEKYMCNSKADCSDGSDEYAFFCKGLSVAINIISC